VNAAQAHALLLDRGHLRRRNRVNRVVEAASTAAALLAVAVLLIVVGSVLTKGAGALSLHFLTTPMALFGEAGGGISNAIVG
jgi:ABC-type phosphate transport system permease subunit